MSMIFGMVKIPDVPDMPPATTGDEIRVEEAADLESEGKTDEEMLVVAEKASYEGLTETQKAMVDAVVQDSLVDRPLAAPSGSGTAIPSELTPGTDAQVQIDAPGTDAQTNGVTE
uniref:Polyprotein protein n=1 Tax=Solanum tuberosum TaxID=4113 RepID=M1DKG3_SOLTU